MPSLKEIAESLRPKSLSVPVGGNQLDIRGLSSGEVADIVERFPTFGDFINQGRDGIADETGELNDEAAARAGRNIDVKNALTLGRTAWPAVIAAACNEPGDAETETIAASFAFEHQQTLIAAIMRLTFPQARPLADGDAPSKQPLA